jgi:tetratricopeptide (TPR) repeat protein
VVLSLAAGLGEAVRERNHAQGQRDLAEMRLEQVRKLAQSFESTFRSLEELGRPEGPARRALADARKQTALQPENRQFREDLAKAYQTIADILDVNGQLSEAESMAKNAVSAWETIVNAYPGDTQPRSALEVARSLLAKIRTRRSVLGSVPSSTNPTRIVLGSPEVVVGYERLGDMLRLTGDIQGAIRAYSTAAAELNVPENVSESRLPLRRLYGVLADLYSSTGNTSKSSEYRQAADHLK